MGLPSPYFICIPHILYLQTIYVFLFSQSGFCFFYENGIIIKGWLFLLPNIIVWRFTQLVPGSQSSFTSTTLWPSSLIPHQHLLIHSTSDDYLGCLELTIMLWALICMCFFMHMCKSFRYEYLWPYHIRLGCFSRSVYTPKSNVKCLLLCIFNICYQALNVSTVGLIYISLIIEVHHLSTVYWSIGFPPSVSPIFQLDCLFVFLSVEVLYISWILIPCQYKCHKHFTKFVACTFISFVVSIYGQKFCILM